MPIALRNGLSYCLLGNQAVFLDRERDRYFALSPSLTAVLTEAAITGRAERMIDLQRAGIVVPSPVAKSLLPQPAVTATGTLLAPSRVRFSLATFESTVRQLRLARRLRRRGLAHILRCVEARKRQRSCAGSIERIARYARAAAPSDLLLTRSDHCLVKSLALMELLAAHGCDAELIFGVRLRPFHAHCWVQAGATLLNEEVEVARAHTPILRL